ncbi:MAG: hypothetical protein ACI9KE_000912 [Polyangiales bacterium]|jgi:hypothetical protein
MNIDVKIPFNAMPESTRLRFAAATKNQGGPNPVSSLPTSRGGAFFGWSLLLLGAAGLALGVMASDFGSLYHARMDAMELLAIMALAFLGGYALLAIVRRVVLDKGTPFRRGRYLFATDIVDATKPDNLRIVPLARISQVNVVHHLQNGRYQNTVVNFVFPGGKTERFTFFGRQRAQDALDRIAQNQREIMQFANAGDAASIAARDVFFDIRNTSIWNEPPAAQQAASHASGQAVAAKLMAPLKWASVTAVGLTFLVVPVWFVRNTLSDDAAFEEARARNTSQAFQTYLRNGSNHEAEAQELLFATAFQEAQATGTVTALREYMQQHPNSPHLPEVRVVVHQRFEVVKANFLAQAATADPNMPRFVQALLAWLEAHDSPPVQVRFSPPTSESLVAIDTALSQESSNVSPIAPHFTDARSMPRENQITEILQQGFATVFPSDVMSMSHAGRILPGVISPVPTVDIAYEIRPSGTTFTDEQNGSEFVGIHVNFNVSMHIPNDPTTHAFSVGVQPPNHFSVSYEDGIAGGPSDGLVYSTMSRLAFARLASSVTMAFFRPGTEAFTLAAGQGGNNPAGGGCTNTCSSANDSECDDGGPDSLYAVCDLGTDCADCGPRPIGGGGGAAAPPTPRQTVPAPNGCNDTCNTSNDSECDDGGPDSLYDICALGTDCADCGQR